MKTQKERKAEKDRLWLWQLEQERLRQEAADAKARVDNLLTTCSQLADNLRQLGPAAAHLDSMAPIYQRFYGGALKA